MIKKLAQKWRKKLSLIFKASEHDYRAYFFHYFCDNTPHTFTLIKTEFGNVIAGYTPLAWNSSSYYSHDVEGLSFLLSLDMMKKMEIVDRKKAILCSTGDGPIFGQGYDICIRDQCNLQNEANPCYANFPESYNHSSKYKMKVQKTWSEFCGAVNGCKFRVLEYEVYRIEWEKNWYEDKSINFIQQTTFPTYNIFWHIFWK